VVAYHPNLDLLNQAIVTYTGVDRLYVFANSYLADYQPLHPNAVVVQSSENVGVSGALNCCAQQAIDEGYDWLLTSYIKVVRIRYTMPKIYASSAMFIDNNVGFYATPWFNHAIE